MGPVQLSTLSYRQDLLRQGKGSGWRHRETQGDTGRQEVGQTDREKEGVIKERRRSHRGGTPQEKKSR